MKPAVLPVPAPDGGVVLGIIAVVVFRLTLTTYYRYRAGAGIMYYTGTRRAVQYGDMAI